jgi:hypothetical protein
MQAEKLLLKSIPSVFIYLLSISLFFYENSKPMDVDTLTHMELMEQMVELGTRVMI